MPPGLPLELSTLPVIHPRTDILNAYGISTVVRLSLDPTRLASGTMSRSVSVAWVPFPGGSAPQPVAEEIGWSNVPAHFLASVVKWPLTRNRDDISEEAAIGVMALLLHRLASAEVLSVVQIGSGGDFLIEVQGQPQMQAESSGIRDDPNGYLSTNRIKGKCAQVLTKSYAGFASVVAFSHPPNQGVCCHLRYVSQTGPGSNYPKPKKRKRKPQPRRKKPK